MKGIKEAIIEGEKIYMKKSPLLGWRIVHPIKIDGKINWKNLISGGSWYKLVGTIIFVLLMIGAITEYSNAVRIANECLLNKPVIIMP